MKPLDMADKYPPADESDIYSDDNDDEPTLKVQVPQFIPQTIVNDDPSYKLVLVIGFLVAAVFLPAYYIGMYWLLK